MASTLKVRVEGVFSNHYFGELNRVLVSLGYGADNEFIRGKFAFPLPRFVGLHGEGRVDGSGGLPGVRQRPTGEHYQYDLNLRDIAEVWRRGSVIASWLLDLTAAVLAKDTALSKFAGRVSDSGEGRWTIKAAIDEAVPVPVLTTALYERFTSRGEADFQDKLLSAMRFQFGGHVEKKG
jgi:hypothetical protein